MKNNGGMDAVLPCVGFERWDLGCIGDHALLHAFILFIYGIE